MNAPKATKAIKETIILKIAKDNDLFRSTMITTACHKIVLTVGVSESPDREAVITAVRAFKDFTQDNDPHGEHDFGAITVGVTKYFWKIDYYDSSFEYGADPREGRVSRLLTIMRADEY